MPMYDYKCSRCGKITEDVLEMCDTTDEHICEECNIEMDRMLSAPAKKPEFHPYFSNSFDCQVRSKEHLKALCKATGSRQI